MNKSILLENMEKKKTDFIKNENIKIKREDERREDVINNATKMERFLYNFHFSTFSSLFYALYLVGCFLLIMLLDIKGTSEWLSVVFIMAMFIILFVSERINNCFIEKHKLNDSLCCRAKNLEKMFMNEIVSKDTLKLFVKEFDKEFVCHVLAKYNSKIKNSDLFYEISLLKEGINDIEIANKIYFSLKEEMCDE